MIGDYDVDGIAATYIIYNEVKKINKNVCYCIPSRSCGYQIENSISKYLLDNSDVCVVLDRGINLSQGEIDFLTSRFRKIIIFDHHKKSSQIDIFSHPQFIVFHEEGITTTELVCKNFHLTNDPFYQFLIILSRIGDVFPVDDTLKKSVFNELEILKLLFTDETECFHSLPSRLNSVSRVETEPSRNHLAMQFIENLHTKNYDIAKMLYNNLDSINQQRSAIQLLSLSSIILGTKGINRYSIIHIDNHHPGIISSLSTNILYKTNKFFVAIFCDKGNEIQGSLRSQNIAVDEIIELSKLKLPIINYGGHQFAAGIKIRKFDNYKNIITEVLNHSVECIISYEPKIDPIAITELSPKSKAWVNVECVKCSPINQSFYTSKLRCMQSNKIFYATGRYIPIGNRFVEIHRQKNSYLLTNTQP